MKTGIHPKYFTKATITCACGNVITTGSTREDLKTELCSACHPFYTGVKRMVDTAGRAEKFKQRVKAAEEAKEKKVAKATTSKAKTTDKAKK